jgi:hypothetical protein
LEEFAMKARLLTFGIVAVTVLLALVNGGVGTSPG